MAEAVRAFGSALYDFESGSEAVIMAALEGAVCRMPEPFGTVDAAGVWGRYAELGAAWPDMERRCYIDISGVDGQGLSWVGQAGYYTGTFAQDWLGIPATRRTVHMRFHEFFRMEGDRIVETQFGWDIPEVMMQAGAWPMVPSLGREWNVPAPATCDGLGPHEGDPEAAKKLILDMLGAMSRHPAEGGPEVMEMDRYWHSKMHWYGPAGIGTARGIEGFRRHHQIPFLAAMPNRGKYREEMVYHFFAEGDYVGVTGWPNMRQTLSDAGWLGLPGVGKEVTMKSLDFWRIENGMIRENWVMVDLIDLYQQLGVDVFARMEELK
ncbi:MAG: ester cyclase [Pseudomonadota bacterium]